MEQQQPQEQLIQCAVCFEEKSKISFPMLPCCGSGGKEETFSVRVCGSCLVAISNVSSHHLCRCPRCRSWLTIAVTPNATKEEEIVTCREVSRDGGKCTMCQQNYDHLVVQYGNGYGLCNACEFGRTNPLRYSCQRCKREQTISHPMYRYQPSVSEYGGATWACHQGCHDYTTWKIVPRYVSSIPLGDLPESWGNDYLEQAREIVRHSQRGGEQQLQRDSTCVIQ